MGVLGNGGATGDLPMAFEAMPRVFVRRQGKEYEEVAGVTSFERNDDAGPGMISFGLAEGLAGAAKEIVGAEGDSVDVKMEFMIGMLMVMTFSGFVEQVSADKVSFSLSTPIETDVLDVAQ